MLSLWSRATRTRTSCRCVSCLSATAHVGRRLATSAGRRQLRFGDYVYMFSTGIFASAAVADANVKEKRRHDLDSAIAEERRKLGAWPERQPDVYPGVGDVRQLDVNTTVPNDGLHNGQAMHIPFDEIIRINQKQDQFGASNSTGAGAVRDFVSVDTGESEPKEVPHPTDNICMEPSARAEWEAYAEEDLVGSDDENLQTLLTGRTALTDHPNSPQWNMRHFPPQSVYAEEPSTVKTKHLWGSKKMRTIELSVAKLVYRLMLLLGESGYEDQRDLQILLGCQSYGRLEGGLFSLETKLRLLVHHNRVYESPRYPHYNQDGDADFRLEVWVLNCSLMSLFRQHQAEEIDFKRLVPRVCDNLLTCSAPPNINTYNLMISCLSKLSRRRSDVCSMAQYIIDSLLETKIRPNEFSYRLILNHYTNIGDKSRFIKFVRLIAGHDEGLMLARPDIQITDAGASRLLRRGHKVVQVPTLDRDDFSALIGGVLRFSGLEAAIQIVNAMQLEGWSVDVKILYRFLKACSETRDWEAGKALWEGIIAQEDMQHLGPKIYQWMLRLCWRCAKTEEFKELYHEALAWGYKACDLLKYITGTPRGTDSPSFLQPEQADQADVPSGFHKATAQASREPVIAVGVDGGRETTENDSVKQHKNADLHLNAGPFAPTSSFQQSGRMGSTLLGVPEPELLSHTSDISGVRSGEAAEGSETEPRQPRLSYSTLHNVVGHIFNILQPRPSSVAGRSEQFMSEGFHELVPDAVTAPLSRQVKRLSLELHTLKHVFADIQAGRTRRKLILPLNNAIQAVEMTLLTVEHQIRTMELDSTKRAIREQAAKVYQLNMAYEVANIGIRVASFALDLVDIQRAVTGYSSLTSEFLYCWHAHKDTILRPVYLPSGRAVDRWNRFKKWKTTFLNEDWTWFARQRIEIGLFAQHMNREPTEASEMQESDGSLPWRKPERDRALGDNDKEKQLQIYFQGSETMEILASLRDYASLYGLRIVERKDMGFFRGYVVSLRNEIPDTTHEVGVSNLPITPDEPPKLRNTHREDSAKGSLIINRYTIRSATMLPNAPVRRVSVRKKFVFA